MHKDAFMYILGHMCVCVCMCACPTLFLSRTLTPTRVHTLTQTHTERWWWERRWWTRVRCSSSLYARHLIWMIYEWVMSHIRMSHVAHMIESCHTYEWAMPHIWLSHVTHMNESWRTYDQVMSHIWMSVSVCCSSSLCARLLVPDMIHPNEISFAHMCDVWHDSFLRDLTHARDMTHPCVIWL